MASVYLSAQSNKPGSSELVLINGEPSTTGYRLLNVDVGNPSFDKKYSGPRGTQGAVLTGETAQNRLSTFRLQAVGTSQDDLEAKLSVLWALEERLRRYGGTVTWRPQGGSYRMKIRALDSGIALETLEPALFVLNNRANVSFGVVSGPYYEGESYDVIDTFDIDSRSDYTFDSGAAGDLSVTGLQLAAAANLTTEKRGIHTARGYLYGDQQVSGTYTPGPTITSFKGGVVLKRIDASNYLDVYVDDNGTNSRLRIDKVVASSRTNLTSTNLGARVVNAQFYYVRGRIEGNVVVAEYFLNSLSPTPTETPTTTNTTTLAGGDATLFGVGAQGRGGFSWIPQHASARLDDFIIFPFVYRAATLPRLFDLGGAVVGDAPALGSVACSLVNGGNSIPFMLLAWWLKPTATGNPDPLSIIEAETGTNLTLWASTADGNYRGGNGLKRTTAGGEALVANWAVYNPGIIPDDYRGSEIDVEVWARVELASTLVNPRLTLSRLTGVSAGYTVEYGTVGKALTKPSSGTQFRFVRLGTLTLPNLASSTIRLNGNVDAGSTGQFGIDYLVLVPIQARALSPSGKALDGSYPKFLGIGDMTKTIQPDLAGTTLFSGAQGTGAPQYPDSGLGGSLIELPYGSNLSLLVKPSSLVPDDPTSDATTERLADTLSIRLADVRPRWRLARSS